MFYIFKKFTVKNWLFIGLIFLLTLIQVYFTMEIVGSVSSLTSAINNSSPEAIHEIWRWGLWMGICALLLASAQIVIQFLASYTASNIATNLRNSLYEKVNKFSLSDLANFSTESLITRTTNDIQNIHMALLMAFRTIFIAPITMVWSILLLVQQANMGLTIVTVVWLVAMIIVVVLLMIMVMPKFNKTQKLLDSLNVASRENLTGVRVVRAFNAEEYQEGKFEVVNEGYTRLMVFVGRAVALFTPFVMFVMMGLTLSLLWITAFIINGMNVADAANVFKNSNSFVMLASQIIMSFVLLITIMILWPRACVCANRIKEVMLHKESVQDPENPKSFIEKGTTPFQRTVMATLETAGETIIRENVTAPAITIMGDVVELSKSLAWKQNLPLSGKRLVVTRSAKQSSGITSRLTALGAEVIETSMIETRGLAEMASADFANLKNFDVLAFTSANGVEHFFTAFRHQNLDVRILAGKKIASVGKITEKKLLEYGILCDYVPEDHTGEGLGKLLAEKVSCAEIMPDRILLLQGNLADETLLKLLPAATRWIVYETLPAKGIPAWKREAISAADAVVFASSSAVEAFVANTKASDENALEDAAVDAGIPKLAFCIGRLTEATARKNGFETITSDETSMDSLVKKIAEFYSR